MDDGSKHVQNMSRSTHQLSLHSKIKSLRNINIPPRMILSRVDSLSFEPSMQMHSHLNHNHNHQHQHQHQHYYKNNYYYYNNNNNNNNNNPNPRVFTRDTDDDSNLYASDEFRMYEYKVRKCTRSRSHDWTDCPFAHPGEKARRRCPRRFPYAGELCPAFRRGFCFRGDHCGFAHGVFEHWLHPSCYRTQPCKDGTSCQRKICFFAHTPTELRSHVNSNICGSCGRVCGIPHSVTPSPTSILDHTHNLSPDSPPYSPVQSGEIRVSSISRLSSRLSRTEPSGSGVNQFGYNEVMHNMQAMNLNASVNDGAMALPDFEWVNDLLT